MSELWNALPQSVKDCQTKNQLKNTLNINPRCKIQKAFHEHGQRKANILHCRLRNFASSLNSDLFKANLVPSSVCECGHEMENSKHFLLYCPKYNIQRNKLVDELRWCPTNITVEFLIHGDPGLNIDDNIKICQSVHNFLTRSNRFDA